jgi:hypothetical protein
VDLFAIERSDPGLMQGLHHLVGDLVTLVLDVFDLRRQLARTRGFREHFPQALGRTSRLLRHGGEG